MPTTGNKLFRELKLRTGYKFPILMGNCIEVLTKTSLYC